MTSECITSTSKKMDFKFLTINTYKIVRLPLYLLYECVDTIKTKTNEELLYNKCIYQQIGYFSFDLTE